MEAPLAFGVEIIDAYGAVLTITRISVATDGTQGNGSSINPNFSVEGNYVAFSSSAYNLVSGHTGGISLFVRDTVNNITSDVFIQPRLPAPRAKLFI